MSSGPDALLSTLSELTSTLVDPTDAELDAQLAADGIDPARVAARVLGRVQRATWLGSARLDRSEHRATSRTASARAAGLDRAQLLDLIRAHRGAVSAQFRNADVLPDEDLRQIVVDLGLLDGG